MYDTYNYIKFNSNNSNTYTTNNNKYYYTRKQISTYRKTRMEFHSAHFTGIDIYQNLASQSQDTYDIGLLIEK